MSASAAENAVSETVRHLALFGSPVEKHTFQTFDDNREIPSGEDARIFHGTFEDVASELARRNAAGQGVFVAVNETDLRGREAQNVTALRVLVIDEDIKDGKGAISAPFLKQPSLIVQSGNGRHVYWRLAPDQPLSAFREAQKRLASYYGTDPMISDLPRVLRLAGLLHMKGEPTMVRVLSDNVEATYTIEELMEGIPPLPAEGVESKSVSSLEREERRKRYEVLPMSIRADAAKEWLINDAPPAIQGENGHGTLMGVTGRLVNGYLLDWQTTHDLLVDHYNQRCIPPFKNLKEIAHKIDDAYEDSFHNADYYLAPLFEKWFREHALPNIKAPDIKTNRDAKTESDTDAKTPSKPSLIRWWSAPDFAASTPAEIPWICEPFIAEKAITEIDGKVKNSGKTTFACAMTKKILNGQPFLNRPTTKTNILYLTEAPETAWRQTMERGELLDEKEFRFISTKEIAEAARDAGRSLSFADIVGDAVSMSFEVGAKVLVIDTLSEFSNLDDEKENDSGAAKKVTDVLKMAANAGLGVVVIRHDRKRGGSAGDSARGSSAFSGQVDQIVHIEEPSKKLTRNQRYLTVKGRLGEGFNKRILEVNTKNWEYSLEEDVSSEVRKGTLRAFILSALPRTQADAEARKMTEKAFITVVQDLSRTGDCYRRTEIASAVSSMIADGMIGVFLMRAKGQPKVIFKRPNATVSSPLDTDANSTADTQ